MLVKATSIIASTSRCFPRRTLTTFPPLFTSRKPNFSRPSPPPLPPSEQAEFDALIKANQTIGASPAITTPAEQLRHQDLRRGPKPDFEGEVNPRTGEQGGPRIDPFKAGPGDWQYGGRVTVSRLGWSVGLKWEQG